MLQAAAIGMAGFTALIFIGLQSTTAINGALINAATPVFVMLLSLVGVGETSTRRQVAGAAVAFVGLVSVVTEGAPARLLTLDINPGDAWVLVAMFGWALYSIMLKTRPSALSPFVYLTVTVSLAAIILAPVFAVEVIVGHVISPTPRAITAILYLGLFASLSAFLCWNYGVRRVGAGPASLFTYLIPVFAALFAVGDQEVSLAAVLMLDERLELFHLVGAALIVAGIGIANMPVRHREGA